MNFNLTYNVNKFQFDLKIFKYLISNAFVSIFSKKSITFYGLQIPRPDP